ncbi:glycosyltransferase [Caballeronia sp. LZ019]|uniref:glycosyltransferase n=1 Tax=Caballeronia sp. LZ019 TaxID=3038555 RepID=UPI00285EDE49|nr:glycosyltransferase [Caballeronia sp. LZ019]MDR5808526.1 glycosyltransferase [Caballeronia sp. LZ019]
MNCARFKARPGDAPLSREPLRALLAARMLWDKGIAEFIDAARALKREGRTIRFILAGMPDAGNPASIDRATIEGWVSEGLVEWRGHVSDMPALLADTDVMVLPSYREGLPKSLIEAAACALPLITTDAPGCREVVSVNGEDGLIVPVRDAVALADAMRLIDDDRALARKLGLAARDKALREFDEAIVIDKTLGVYQTLAPVRQAAPSSVGIAP